MTGIRRRNLAGITSAQLLAKIEEGKPFFVRTRSANVTRQLLSWLKKRHQLDVSTHQEKQKGLWIIPKT